MNSETKICQNCKKEFVIEPEDFDFYQKIKVPAPTFCPECRLIRRMIFRNERSLYKRKCDAPDHNEDIISIYSPDKPLKIYDQKYWWSDSWDPMEYGRDYDFSKPFFEQFNELLMAVPRPPSIGSNNINSDYTNYGIYNKNCYLIVSAEKNEDCLYGHRLFFNRDCVDCENIHSSELCYQCFQCINCYKCIFSQRLENCNDLFFCFDCRNCQNCFSCVGLRNKQYHIFNKPYTKEQYFSKLKEFGLDYYSKSLRLKEEFEDFYLKFPRRFAEVIKSENCVGNNINNSKNCFNSFVIKESKDLKYVTFAVKAFSSMDGSYIDFSEWTYESFSGEQDSNKLFTCQCWFSNNLQYCDSCTSSFHLFACIGLRNKQYCILNKQYTKEEYEKLVPKIIQHMNDMPYIDKKGRVYKYGEFFPPELSPFAYNETVAQEYFPLTKEQALKQGYSWKDPEERDIKPDIKTAELPDHIKDVKDDIIGKVIQCAHAKLGKDGTLETNCNEQCTTAFKIIEPELQFYRRMNLPLPRLCPNCRHYQRLKQRNPLKLWHRKCMCGGQTSTNGVYKNTIKHFHGNQPCPNEFETTYAPDRPEIVYCEKCYLDEVV